MSFNHGIGKSFISWSYFHRLHQCSTIRNCSFMSVPLKISYSSKLLSSQLRFSSISSTSNFTIPNSDDISSALKQHYGQDRFSVNPLNLPKSPQPDPERFNGFIPIDRLEIKTVCSSGPGGQHVNKTHSKVEMRFQVQNADWLPTPLREFLLKSRASELTRNGELVVTSSASRYQLLNRADCLNKLRERLWRCESERDAAATRERAEKQAREKYGGVLPERDVTPGGERALERARRASLRHKHINTFTKKMRSSPSLDC